MPVSPVEEKIGYVQCGNFIALRFNGAIKSHFPIGHFQITVYKGLLL